jgi:hypothetical protein
MKALILAALILSTSASADVFLEIGAGQNNNLTGCSICWDNGGGTGAYFALRYEEQITESITGFAQYSHYSQYEIGVPFNNKPESSLDHIGVGLRFRIMQ